MSDDLGIVFGEVSYREPRRLRRPDRDSTRCCLAVAVPRPGDLPIFLDRKPADAIERHALRDTSVELGGILLGQECLDDETGAPFVWITEALEAKHYENTQASFTYTHDSWAEINRERDERFPDLDIIGWYHTHPDFGVFLSGHDLFIHHHFFAQPLNVAYVVDPVRQTRGFFQWRGDRVDEVGGFYLTSDRHDRVALARFVHDLENLPGSDGGGGSLSPRLEAELIAMLNRPQTSVVTAAPSVSLAAVFALLGMMLGVLAMAAGLWVYRLGQAIQEQTVSLKNLEKSVAERTEDERYARLKIKEEALDRLLREVHIGATTDTFIESYNRVVQEREEAQKALKLLQTREAALAEQNTQLRTKEQNASALLASARKKAQEAEKGSTEAAKKYEAELADLNGKLKAAEDLVQETGAGALAWKYRLAWYVAAGGLTGCILLGLALVWSLGRTMPTEDEGGAEHDRPLHRIT